MADLSDTVSNWATGHMLIPSGTQPFNVAKLLGPLRQANVTEYLLNVQWRWYHIRIVGFLSAHLRGWMKVEV